ncbi:hypothetical protein DUNSADRAFT_5526 [Dunaliella salina]|uniref:Uncharacterized protein n=1 Tax=Dunaliella salina TaxID=3046 RepID=A0ABQ7GQ51_DUNSA|nr:hypothetical protein DUNSADRAFT_5526 [Dunaliella salina]|eukprot:KAF5836737.1 hypothetical protein DUNSADRAFT_5526 [Dunaliella salina]
MGVVLQSGILATLLGELMASLPSLKVQVEIIYCTQDFAGLMMLCAALGPGANHVQEIQTLESVRTRDWMFRMLA